MPDCRGIRASSSLSMFDFVQRFFLSLHNLFYFNPSNPTILPILSPLSCAHLACFRRGHPSAVSTPQSQSSPPEVSQPSIQECTASSTHVASQRLLSDLWSHPPTRSTLCAFNRSPQTTSSPLVRRGARHLLSQFRASTDQANWSGSTGVRVVLRKNRLYAPLDSNQSYSVVAGTLLKRRVIYQTRSGDWCFAVHDSCWQLLLLRVGRAQIEGTQIETTVAGSLFDLLFCSPCPQESSFYFGHDYEGAARTHRARGAIQPVDPESLLYADPRAIPSGARLEANGSFWKMLIDTHQATRPTIEFDRCRKSPLTPIRKYWPSAIPFIHSRLS